MKAILFSLILINTCAFSQCPESGLKIQSKGCEEPHGLVVSKVSCTEMNIKWAGSKTQSYTVTATITDGKSGNFETAHVSEVVNENGNCSATITVTEGETVKWRVQSICTINGARLYSTPAEGAETYVPVCRPVRDDAMPKGFAIYPNPTKGPLVVEYTGNAEELVLLNVYDINGKKIFTQNQRLVSGTANKYKLDLHNLPPGAYTLEMVNGTEVKQAKFVLLRN